MRTLRITGMGETVLLGAYQKRVLARLTPYERHIAQTLLNVAPNWRYDLSGLPRLDPPPPPGPESAAAAARAMMRWVKPRRVD